MDTLKRGEHPVAHNYRQVMWNRRYNPAAKDWWNRNCRVPVFKRDGWKCVRCGIQRAKVTYLVCHHTTYKDPKTGKSIIGREDKYTHLLVTLCPHCHDWVHGKLWYQKLFR